MKTAENERIPDMLTSEDVMRLCRWKDVDAVYRQIRAGRLRTVEGLRPYRITREAFLDFLHGRHDPRPAASGRGGRRRSSEASPAKPSGAATLIEWMKDVEPVIRAR